MRSVMIHFEDSVSADEFAAVPGVRELRVDGTVLRCKLDGRADALVKAAAQHTVLALTVEEADLEELFFHHYANDGGANDAA